MSIPFEALVSLREAKNDLVMCEAVPGRYRKLIAHAEKRIRHAKKILAEEANQVPVNNLRQNTTCNTDAIIK